MGRWRNGKKGRMERWKDGKLEGLKRKEKDMNFLFPPLSHPFHLINLFNLFDFF